MLDWWNALTQDNQIKLSIVPITTFLAGLGYLLKKLFDKKQQSALQTHTIQGDTNTQTTNSGTAIINSGSGNVSTSDTYHIGITLEQYEKGLKRREAEVRKELKQTHDTDRQRKEIELQAVQQQLQNISTSYEAHITSLKERITQLEGLRGQLADDVLTEAINAVAKGDNEQADQLFKQIEEQADSVIKVAAEAAFQRCLIAEDAIRYTEALEHCEKAVRLAPDNSLYLSQAGMINQTLADFKKAIDYHEQALASDLKTYGEAHPKVARDRNNLGSAWKSLGETQKAIDYFEQALATCEEKLGKDHPNTKTVRANLAGAREELEKSATQ